MLFVDVNILIYAHRPESPRHSEYRAWLEARRAGVEPVALADIVASGFVRVVTHPKVFLEPTPTAVALDFVANLHASPATLALSPGERTWSIFENLARSTEAKGNQVPDTFLAAMAIEQSAVLVSADRGFARFPGLAWRHPLQDP